MTGATRRWHVGEVAETSGLTVRTLHHWDGIGVLRPSVRGAGGRREYTEDDLGRLYVVLALRHLGLDLESIRSCLDGGLDPRRALADHLEQLEGALAALGQLRDRVAGVVAAGADSVGGAGSLDMLRLMRAARGGAAEVLNRHLGTGPRRPESAGDAAPSAAYVLEIEWPRLYRQAEELRLAGALADDPRVQRIAGRMDQLAARFGTEDAGFGTAVRAAWAEDPAAMSGEPEATAGPWRELARFVNEARGLNAGGTR